MTNLQSLKDFLGFFDLENLEQNDFNIITADPVESDKLAFERTLQFHGKEFIERISYTKENKTFTVLLFDDKDVMIAHGSFLTVQEGLTFFEIRFAEFRFIELDKKYDGIKNFFDEYKESKENLIRLAGLNHFFTDSDKTVYKTIIPPGKYVYFETSAVARTARKLSEDDESKGSYVLTQKEAIENGFELPEKIKKVKPKKDQDLSGEF